MKKKLLFSGGTIWLLLSEHPDISTLLVTVLVYVLIQRKWEVQFKFKSSK